jgi:hypothetical protein
MVKVLIFLNVDGEPGHVPGKVKSDLAIYCIHCQVAKEQLWPGSRY